MALPAHVFPEVPPTTSSQVRLTRKERDLLAFLRQNAGQCLSRELLLQHVWGYREGVKSRTLDVHVQRLRKKLGPVEGRRILTVFRGGYLWSGANGEISQIPVSNSDISPLA